MGRFCCLVPIVPHYTPDGNANLVSHSSAANSDSIHFVTVNAGTNETFNGIDHDQLREFF
jgi:hypothetical protein